MTNNCLNVNTIPVDTSPLKRERHMDNFKESLTDMDDQRDIFDYQNCTI